MDKKILIGGGAVIVVGGILILRSRKRAAVDETAANAQTVGNIPSYANSAFSSMLPISGGITSQQQSDAVSNSTPSDPSNSGSSATGGGFDFGAMFSSLIGANLQHQNAQTAADATTADSAILASIIGNKNIGKISHSGSETSISLGAPSDAIHQLVEDEYRNTLGRDAESSGEAYWTNRLYNDPSFSVAQLHQSFVDSAEYKAKNAAAAKS